MAYRQRVWARKQRLKLRRLLGLKCKNCKSKDYRKLEFDVIIPIDEEVKHHKMEWSWRMSFYNKQFKVNNLQLLCQSCHNHKTYEENYKNPF